MTEFQALGVAMMHCHTVVEIIAQITRLPQIALRVTVWTVIVGNNVGNDGRSIMA